MLKNEVMTVELITYGAHLYRLFRKEWEGKSVNIVLNVTSIEALTTDLQYFGAKIGPVAGRMSKGRLGDIELEQNENGNCLASMLGIAWYTSSVVLFVPALCPMISRLKKSTNPHT